MNVYFFEYDVRSIKTFADVIAIFAIDIHRNKVM